MVGFVSGGDRGTAPGATQLAHGDDLAFDLAYYTAQSIDGGPYSPAPQYRSHAPKAALAGDVVPVAENAGHATLMPHLQVAIRENDPTSWVLVVQSGTTATDVSMAAAFNPGLADGRIVMAGFTPERTATTVSTGIQASGATATPLIASLHDGATDLPVLDALFTADGWGNP